eukprot:5193908-Amphidinium_carterae.1
MLEAISGTRPIDRDSFVPTTWGNDTVQYHWWSWFTDALLKQFQRKGTVAGYKETRGDNDCPHSTCFTGHQICAGSMIPALQLETSAGGESANKVPSATAVTAPRRRKTHKISFTPTSLVPVSVVSSEAASFHSANQEDDPDADDEEAEVPDCAYVEGNGDEAWMLTPMWLKPEAQ